MRKPIVLVCCAVLMAACAPAGAARPVATLAPAPVSGAAGCAWEEVLPSITEVQPARITPESEVSLVGSGGFLRDNCGGYNESARTYQIFVDDEAVGELVCYVNRCQGMFTLPQRAGVGRHCLGVQKGTCPMELNVVGA